MFFRPSMIWIRARIDLFAMSALLGIAAFVMGLVSCVCSHVVMADFSYVHPSQQYCEFMLAKIMHLEGMT